jgi:hypothetical protein
MDDAQYPSRSSITVISTPRLHLMPLKSGPGYTDWRALPWEYSRRFRTAEIPPYAQPTTRMRCGFDSATLLKASVTFESLIFAKFLRIKVIESQGVVEGNRDDLIRLQPCRRHMWAFLLPTPSTSDIGNHTCSMIQCRCRAVRNQCKGRSLAWNKRYLSDPAQILSDPRLAQLA